MKTKFLAILSLTTVIFLGACGGKEKANTNAANTATVNMNMTTATPVTKTNETAATDPNLKSKVETALKAKGFNDVTIDTTTTPATLRGTVAKDKLAEAYQTAMEAAGKPLNNQITEK